MTFTYGSVCSGIESASVAWKPLGWTAAWFSEIEKFPSAVLKHHYPDVENRGDMTKFKEWPDGTIDALVGGTPCQSFSVAGLRKGLDDPRGNLMLTYCAIARRYRPRWIVWENVFGVLSSNGGRDFATFLRALEGLGYGWAYRICDAQYWGVAQRRKRVFVVGYLGDWRRAAAVVFEREGLSGYIKAGREAGEEIAVSPSLRARANSSHRADSQSFVAHALRGEGFDASEDGTGRGTPLVATTLRARDLGRGVDSDCTDTCIVMAHGQGNAEIVSDGSPSLTCNHEAPICFHNRQDPDVSGDQASPIGAKDNGLAVMTLAIRGRKDGSNLEVREDGLANAVLTPNGGRAGIGVGAVAIPINSNALRGDSCAITPSPDSEGRIRLRDPGLGVGRDGDPADTLQAAGPGAVAFAQNTRDEVREMSIAGALSAQTGTHQTSYVRNAMQVRRLTPKECARLQGFPDDYLDIIYRGKPACDGPKYKALGNSMVTNVMAYIGKRIQMVEDIGRELENERHQN